MKNIINYFYNIKIDNIKAVNNSYYFTFDNRKYIFNIVNADSIDVQIIQYVNNYLLQNSEFGGFILIPNKNNDLLTTIDNNSYILMLDQVLEDGNLTLQKLSKIDIYIPRIPNGNYEWETLWMNKIDYFEDYISKNFTKYHLVTDYLDYFIGICENAIQYYKNTAFHSNYDLNKLTSISHKRITTDHTLREVLNPLNLIVDLRVRDIAEYFKMRFLNGYMDIDIDSIIKLGIDNYEIRLFIARMLFPSFFFDAFENMNSGSILEKDIVILIEKMNQYQQYISNLFNELSKYYLLPEIKWIKKVDYSSTFTTPSTSGTSFINMASIPSFSVTSIMLQ